jgi:hypothetical protein
MQMAFSEYMLTTHCYGCHLPLQFVGTVVHEMVYQCHAYYLYQPLESMYYLAVYLLQLFLVSNHLHSTVQSDKVHEKASEKSAVIQHSRQCHCCTHSTRLLQLLQYRLTSRCDVMYSSVHAAKHVART